MKKKNLLNENVKHWANALACSRDELVIQILHQNDYGGRSFEQIADWLEKTGRDIYMSDLLSDL